jgi:hypothetical protein
MPVSLAAIRQMLKNRQYEDARSALDAFLRANPRSAEAWYLLSMAAETPPRRLAAIRKAAKLAPNNARVQARLQKLQRAPGARSGRGRLVLALLVLAALAVAAVVLRVNAPPTPPPTTAIAAADTPTAQPSATPTTAPATDAATITQPAADTPTAQPSATPATPTSTLTATPTLTPPAPTNTALPPTAISVLPTSAPQVVMPLTSVVMNEAQEVGAGEMWVVDASRAAESLILEIGGSVEPAPPGYTWLLVELFMLCSGAENCAPPTTALQVVGPSRVPYPPAPGITIQPTFGPAAYVDGQVWGYLGFLVPSTEAPLSLLLTQPGQQFAFDLQ